MIELPEKVAEFFPYKDVRPFQDEFIRTIHDAIREGRSPSLREVMGLERQLRFFVPASP